MEIKRCTILIPSDGSLYERMDDPTGQWVYDPDYKIEKFIEYINKELEFLRQQNMDLVKAIEKVKASFTRCSK
jgi:hypothetical protein